MTMVKLEVYSTPYIEGCLMWEGPFPVWVNPEQVSFVTNEGSMACTGIGVSKFVYWVKMTPEETLKKLGLIDQKPCT